jgi:hypothetical protein
VGGATVVDGDKLLAKWTFGSFLGVLGVSEGLDGNLWLQLERVTFERKIG